MIFFILSAQIMHLESSEHCENALSKVKDINRSDSFLLLIILFNFLFPMNAYKINAINIVMGILVSANIPIYFLILYVS